MIAPVNIATVWGLPQFEIRIMTTAAQAVTPNAASQPTNQPRGVLGRLTAKVIQTMGGIAATTI